MNSIHKELHKDMVNIYTTAKKETKYNPTLFLRMISEMGAYETARRIVTKKEATTGFTQLWNEGRLDLSVEALILRKYRNNFEPAIVQMCIESLKEYGYDYQKELENELDSVKIQIIPMSKVEFEGSSIEEVQVNYFLEQLPNTNKYTYYYCKNGIKSEGKVLFLFQYDNHIIASAMLEETLTFENPVEGKYYGAWRFERDSIHVFAPINGEEIKNIDSNFNRFSQAKSIIGSQYLKDIQNLIETKKNVDMAEEIIPFEAYTLIEGAKKQIVVNAYERNTVARQKCIDYYKQKDRGKVKCQICSFCFEDFYGEEFKDKIHVHHIKSLAEINEVYEVNPIDDLIPVCPNCHLALHSKKDGYMPKEIKDKISNRVFS